MLFLDDDRLLARDHDSRSHLVVDDATQLDGKDEDSECSHGEEN